jgi:transcriptional regulator with XRE-family HTH domain
VPKTTFSPEYDLFCRLLRECRQKEGLTQIQLCLRLEKPQSFVSKYEMGERRIDVIELWKICGAFGITLTEFASQLEVLIASDKKARAKNSGGGTKK